MRKLVLLGILLSVSAVAAAGPCAFAAPTPPSQAQIDSMIHSACLQEGGKPEECQCGLKIAREGLTERQFAIFPILWPIVNGKGDSFAKLAAGVTALQGAGYTASDGLELMAILQANASRVEKECRAPQPAKP